MAPEVGTPMADVATDVDVTAALVDGFAGCESGDAAAALALESLGEALAEELAESLRGCGFLSSAKLGSANKNIAAERMAARSSNRMYVS